MKELTLPLMYTILKEIFGGMFFPFVFILFFVIFAFIAILIIEKRFYYKRVLASLAVGLVGGIVGLYIFKSFSVSPSIIVISSPVDLMLNSLNYLGGVLLVAMIVYAFIGFMGKLKKSGCPIDRKLR